MEPSRIEAYVRTACSVLDFDVGEIWSAKKSADGAISLRFVHQHFSPAFQDFRSLLDPSIGATQSTTTDESRHRLSPIVCRGVCDGGKILWANSRNSEVVTGRSGVPFNTAVGVPLRSIGNELYILVLLAVVQISSDAKAIAYLGDIMRGVSATSGGFLPVVSSKIVPSALPARLESRQVDFCSMIEEYTKDAPPKDIKMTKEMRVRDLNEIVLFGKLYTEFKSSRTGAFSEHQLESLRAVSDKHADRHETLATGNVTCALSALTEVACSAGLMRAVENISGKPTPPDVGGYTAGDSKAPSASELTRFQRLSQALPEVSAFIDKSWGDHTPRELIGHMRRACTPHPSHADWLAPIFAHMTYRQSQTRFHEFMIAVLGATVFDGAELWLRCGPSPGSSSPELHMVAAVHRTAAMQTWTSSSTDLRLAVGSDIPGRVVADGKTLWQDGGVKEESVRAGLAKELDVRGAIGVPLAGLRGPCGALVFYCEGSAPPQTPNPLLVQLLEKAVSLITSDFGTSAVGSEGVGFEDWLKTTLAALEPAPAASSSQAENAVCTAIKLFPELESKVRLCRKIVTQRQVDRVALAAAARAKNADQRVAAAGSASALAVTKAGKRATTRNCKLNATLKRKWICTQNYCHSPSSAEEDYLGEDPDEDEENEVVGDKRKAPSSRAVEDSDSEDDLTEEQVLAIGRGVALPAKKPPAVAPVVKPVSVKATAPPAAAAAKTAAVKTTAVKTTVAGAYAASAAIVAGAAVPAVQAERAVAVVGGAGGAGGSINEDLYSDAVVSAARALANFGNFQWGTFLEGSGIGENSEGYESIKLGSDAILDYAYSADGTRKRKYDRSAARAAAPGVAADGGALPVCLVDGCEYCVENAESLYCATHRGTRRCQKDGCGKCAQGATKYCIAHGGGRRCTYPGCFKGARDKLFCAAHGGGKRCTFESCTKSAVGGSLLCTAHGGGKRCKFEGCNKSSQSSTDYCVKHGGGRSCMFKGCNKVARGKTDFCAAHGGGVRCKAKGCYKIAVGATSLCRMHSTAQAAAAGAAVPPEHANLGSEALKLAVQSAGGVSDDDDDDEDLSEEQILFAAGK